MQEFVLDLTSVCVRSGALQLPSKMLAHFEDGVVKAAAGGGEVELTFTQPRTLSGLRQFFESQGLKANDRLRIELDATAGAARLKLVAERRERPRPADAKTPLAAAQARSVSVARTSTVSEPADPSAMVRVVRKVRIEAQPTGPSSITESRFLDERAAGSESPTSDRRWSSLAGERARPRDAAIEDQEPLTSVRVVRRGQQRQEAVEAVSAPTPQRQDAPATPGGLGALLPLAGRRADQPQAAAEVASHRRTPSHKLSRFGVRFWSERGAAQPLRDANAELITDADVVEDEAHDEAPSAAVAQPAPAAAAQDVEAEVVMAEEQVLATVTASDKEKQAFDAFLGDAGNGGDTRPSAIWRRASRAAAPRQTSTSQAPGFMPPAFTEEPTPAPAAIPERLPTRPGDLSSQALARGEVRVAPLRGAAQEVAEAAEPAVPERALSVEDVMPRINQYLMRPETPAIVQTRTLADDLKLDLELAELAMERLSEDRDRFNRIRPGAYMVRRASLG